MNEILQKIDEMRLARGWSVNNLAMEAMLTQSTVNNLYTRGAEPKLSTLRAICNAFGITLSEFFADEEAEQERNEKIQNDALQKELSRLNYRQKAIVLEALKEFK